MPGTKFPSVDAYIAAQPPPSQEVLERVRALICKALPTAEECISYNIPTYKLPAGPVIYFAGWKRHYSLYPVTSEIVREFEPELSKYEIAKGTVRFPLDQPVPSKLITAIAKLRGKQLQATTGRNARTRSR
jgi:uncharacterized protein YdhG (YjbR/CyaY superfamily)